MAKVLMDKVVSKSNCILSISNTRTMASCSTFCPPLPTRFSTSSLSPKPQFFVSFKAFSSQTPKDESPKRIGFLGLGIMGSPMAQNLIKVGCDVTVWNRTKSKCDLLISLGANYVDVSTVDGSTSKLINKHIKATGALFLEAPVSGSKKPAEDGQLIFLTAVPEFGKETQMKSNDDLSGDRPLYDMVASELDVMGKSRFYLGEVGNGAAMKLVVNMIMGSMMASFSEGLILSEKVGLDPSVLVEVISQGAISAPMYSMKGPSMVKSLYPTAFPLKHQQKDLRLALGLAESVSQPTPIAAAANELYKVAKSHGLSDQDFSAVIEALKVKLQEKTEN
nr:glyoxylate/succinic semialdehyde reductase 2, chloroplastic [Ipomoea batatas]